MRCERAVSGKATANSREHAVADVIHIDFLKQFGGHQNQTKQTVKQEAPPQCLEGLRSISIS